MKKTREEDLDEKLAAYAKTDMYPFHMPGHKRRSLAEINPYEEDITEISGFDNMNQPTGILQTEMKKMAELYRAEEAFFLVNGSTAGNLAAIFAATCQHGKVLMARNCHKSVYHALYLRELEAEYLYPVLLEGDIPGPVSPVDVEKKLEQQTYQAVVITSPTYEGVLSDVAQIAAVCHAQNTPLIVDAAHGAHLGLSCYFPQNPISQGADAVIVSFHKTLPSFTQTGCVLLGKNTRIDKDELKDYLAVFQTSSPSYVFMAGMVRMRRFLETKGNTIWKDYADRLRKFYETTASLQKIKIVQLPDSDPSKIIISTRETAMTGEALFEILRDRYHLELEMASYSYALAMTSVMDTKEGMQRLTEALLKIDDISEKAIPSKRRHVLRPHTRMMTYAGAKKEKGCAMDYRKSAGKIAKDTICLYPPGIPLFVPGEKIDCEDIEDITEAMQIGLAVVGLKNENTIMVV